MAEISLYTVLTNLRWDKRLAGVDGTSDIQVMVCPFHKAMKGALRKPTLYIVQGVSTFFCTSCCKRGIDVISFLKFLSPLQLKKCKVSFLLSSPKLSLKI